ncbi:radical SAM family heme chaperone HemW [Thermocoleostomius sinensis]|uniref:Heme chaperone HemW n=1 Tax=Thermocoleostomius sinensis A174 TaxID=2016057 RepID=A0A9E8ZKG7_9CYAN|nr:radical SAM family heme chaperone HemW [Thermocoleostomius sinensis]WAL62858.1 radical SAM family heme chaperone HemW [Thermocoleostomius sinensis A174]
MQLLSFDRLEPWQVPTAAYVHIPFCRRRCYYCDFPISVVGDRPPLSRRQAQAEQEFGTIAEYVEMLCREIAMVQADEPLETVFFGGGTPSLLTVEQLEKILSTLDQHIGITRQAEISIEIDPGTFDRSRLQGYKAAGVNRVSLGVQAFQSELLAACGRTHTLDDIETAVEWIHQVGITNFSIDLISGLPHLTLENWQDSLQRAIAFAPTHVSVYDLTVEPGTAFDRWYKAGTAPLPTDELTAQMYRIAQATLTCVGYEHYEISNYAKPGYQCRHNRVYWENRSYYGFGMAAASYVNGQRFTRPRKRREYYEWVQALQQRQGAIDCPVVSLDEQLLDTLMLGLRLADGLAIDPLVVRFGKDTIQQVLDCLQLYLQQGWVELLDQTGQPIEFTRQSENPSGELPEIDRIRLSDPEGFLFSNVVLTALFEQRT